MPILRPLCILFLAICASSLIARNDAWNKAQQFSRSEMFEKAEPIFQSIKVQALDDGENIEAAVALICEILAAAGEGGEDAHQVIERLESERSQWANEAQPIFRAILALWYWQHLEDNQYEYFNRSRIDSLQDSSFLHWDASRMLSEIANHFEAALAEEATLLKMDGESTPGLEHLLFNRLSLYESIANSAIDFYYFADSWEPSASRFTIGIDSPAFESSEVFTNWSIKSEEGAVESYLSRALVLYQKLERIRSKEKPDSWLAGTELKRLTFAYKKLNASPAKKRNKLISALQKFIERSAGSPAHVDRAYSIWARELIDIEEPKKLLSFAEKHGCEEVAEYLKAPVAEVVAEKYWTPQSTIDVKYRNTEKIFFRVYSFNYQEQILSSDNIGPFGGFSLSPSAEQQLKLVATEPILKWEEKLPETPDYKTETVTLPIPDDLTFGGYYLISSFSEDFEDLEDFELDTIFYSDLAIITKELDGDGFIHVGVLDAESGEPVSGARVYEYQLDYDKQMTKEGEYLTSDEGWAVVSTDDNGDDRFFLATHDGKQIGTFEGAGNREYSRDDGWKQAYLYTDRKIYRPGDTIHFKGILTHKSFVEGKYSTIENEHVTVRIEDRNSTKVDSLEVTTNKFGSFSGSFVAPHGKAGGRMTIDTGFVGETEIYVEEFKAPNIRVELAPPPAGVVGDIIELSGNVSTYTGAKVGDAQVRYTISRETDFPSWIYRSPWSWFVHFYSRSAEEISSGTVYSDAAGNFSFWLAALGDPTIDKETNPIFKYSVDLTVIDPTGETISASQTVKVSYSDLVADLSLDRWQEKGQPVVIHVSTTTQNGVKAASEGRVTIYSLNQPDKVHRKPLNESGSLHSANRDDSYPSTSGWALGKVVAEQPYQNSERESAAVSFDLNPGIYRAKLETVDKAGCVVEAWHPVQVIDPTSDQFDDKVPFSFLVRSDEVQPGDSWQGVWSSGYSEARAFVEIIHRGRIIDSFWTERGVTQQVIDIPIAEKHLGGLFANVYMVRENRLYTAFNQISVPWNNKKLSIKWTRQRSKLKPKDEVTWTAHISGPGAETVVAEMVATLYDESLEALVPHRWQPFDFYEDRATTVGRSNHRLSLAGRWYSRPDNRFYLNDYHFGMHPRGFSYKKGGYPVGLDSHLGFGFAAGGVDRFAPADHEMQGRQSKGLDFSGVKIRKDLSHTAMFLPHVESQTNGSVTLSFTMPETLTSWKFFGFAHDTEMRSSFLEGSAVSALDVMIQPHPPRFLREGDELVFTAKVINQSDREQKGHASLALTELVSEKNADQALANLNPIQAFTVPAGESRTFSWPLKVSVGQATLKYQAMVKTEEFSDGEEGYLPVLSKRTLVTDSQPLSIRGEGMKNFEFANLLDAGSSDTLEHHQLKVEAVSNPAWLAVLSLPYLSEYPHECSEQLFSRYYANRLASYIARSNPVIQEMYMEWQGDSSIDEDPFGGAASDANTSESYRSSAPPDPISVSVDQLQSPLERNEHLKQILLEETPWVLAAQRESAGRNRIDYLFDVNRIGSEMNSAFDKLKKNQYSNGSFPWFSGGPPNEVITLYIASGFARLRHIGLEDIDMDVATNSVIWIDKQWIMLHQESQYTKKPIKLSETLCLYLYTRSFFHGELEVGEKLQAVFDHVHQFAKSGHWRSLSRLAQGHLAMAIHRMMPDSPVPAAVVKHLRSTAISSEEMGMHWPQSRSSYWHRWSHAPIETQAVMIELFQEVTQDDQAVEECRIWLMKQRQTNSWKTTKATCDAIYALLGNNTEILESDKTAEISLGGVAIEPRPDEVTNGLGHYLHTIPADAVSAEMGDISISKTSDGVAWGSVSWQYFEDVNQVKAGQQDGLTLKKTLYRRKGHGHDTSAIEVIKPGENIDLGDELVTRIELTADRDFEYVHLKDQRGSGCEPVNVLSGYKYKNSLWYYESTKDTASHFFIDYLPRGSYVFEYPAKVVHKGTYQSGIAAIQCMYAPDFNAHSASAPIYVE